MKNYSKKHWLGLLTLLLINWQAGIACGPMLYDEETRFSIFRKESIDDASMDPFHYSHERWSGFDKGSLYTERSQNIDEWYAFGNKTFSKKGTDILQYQATPEAFLKAYNSKDFAEWEGNDFLEFLQKKENKQAYEYFLFAKQVESAQNQNANWNTNWGQVKSVTRNEVFEKLAAEAFQKMNQRKISTFLKERWAFQYVKCAYYQYYYNDRKGNVDKALQVYKEVLAPSNSIVAQWALIYYADMQQDSLERTRYFIAAFDKSADKRLRASQFIGQTDLNELKKVEKDVYYLQMIDIIQTIRSKGRNLDNIKALYQKDKNNKFLFLMMTREINKLEDWIWSNQMLRFSPSYYSSKYYEKRYESGNYANPNADTVYEYYAQKNLESDIKYLQEVLKYYQSLDFGDNTIKNNFRDIAVVHLLNMNGQHKEAEAKLKGMNPNQTKAVTLQYNYEKLIVLVNNYDLKTQRTQDMIAMTIGYQESNQPRADRWKKDRWKSNDEDLYTKEFYGMKENFDPSILVYLGRKYIASGYPEIGALMLQKSMVRTNEYSYNNYIDENGKVDTASYAGLSYLEKYVAPEDIDKVLELKHKKHKTGFEQVYTPDIWESDAMYTDLKGTLYFRQGKYEEALKVFEALPDNFWEKNYEFAQYLPKKSITNLGTYMPKSNMHNGKTYEHKSKKLITEEMLQLQADISKARNPKEKAQAQLYYANALFNVSYYGLAWMAYAYGKSSTEQDGAGSSEYTWAYYYMQPSVSNNVENYYGLKNATEAYMEVLHFDSKSEIGAAAVLMLALCDDLGHNYYQNLKSPYINNYNDSYTSPYYKELKQQYSKTDVYRLAKTHCIDVD